MTTGIYIIQNKINNKVYVGKSINIERRWKQYEYCFRKNKISHINQYLLNSMLLYGYENFNFIVKEECSVSDLSERELFWMNHYKSFDSDYGYNLRVDSSSGMIAHQLTRDKISNRLRNEWKSGIRDLHSEKLKESWNRGDRDRDQQSETMSRALTKYFYKITSESCSLVVKYKQLREMKLHGVIGKFAKYKCDIVQFKDYTIERILVNE